MPNRNTDHRLALAALPIAAMLLAAAAGCQTRQIGQEQWGPPTSTMSGLKDQGMPAGSGTPPMPDGWRGFSAPH